jgi:hypothetical protein
LHPIPYIPPCLRSWSTLDRLCNSFARSVQLNCSAGVSLGQAL